MGEQFLLFGKSELAGIYSPIGREGAEDDLRVKLAIEERIGFLEAEILRLEAEILRLEAVQRLDPDDPEVGNLPTVIEELTKLKSKQ